MTINELKELLDKFLDRWTLKNVRNLTLQEYVGLGNKDTFCQWVETKTEKLGSIKGRDSIKFGIYKRKDKAKKRKDCNNDNEYSWLKHYGDSRKEAFENIKRDIIKTIQLAKVGKFSDIESIPLRKLFKWKVAFLYSNEKLIPIYKKETLDKIANDFGLKADKKTPISEIQKVMMLKKPAHLNVYAFMERLHVKFGGNEDKKEIVGATTQKRQKRITRRAANERNTTTQTRIVKGSYVAKQEHNKIQEALKKLLIDKYGKDSVILEENHVDIKLVQPNYITFYEVKSSSCASDCIKEALGQILLYSLNDTDKRPKKHIVVGQCQPTENEKKYIDFLKQNLKLEFDYLNVKIE